MIITSGIIFPKELILTKEDLKKILQALDNGKTIRLKGLDSDVVFAETYHYLHHNEKIIEVEQYT